MSSSDAKDGQIPESTSTPADPLEAGQSAALGKGYDLSAESGIEKYEIIFDFNCVRSAAIKQLGNFRQEIANKC